MIKLKLLLNNNPKLTKYNIKTILEKNGYTNSVICLHSSFKSFGLTDNGPNTIIDGFLLAGNTILAPAFYYAPEATPIRGNYKQNGIDYTNLTFSPVSYTGLPEQIDLSMGIIPKTMLTYKKAIRSSHPMNSFVAVGPDAEILMAVQDNLIVYSAYKQILADKENAYIFHCGTKLTSCTPVHFAEEMSGKQLFRRWALSEDKVEEIEVGACSDGFENLYPFVKDIEQKIMIGNSETSVFIFRNFIERVAETIKHNPEITRCSDSCIRCRDLVAGGPKLNCISK